MADFQYSDSKAFNSLRSVVVSVFSRLLIFSAGGEPIADKVVVPQFLFQIEDYLNGISIFCISVAQRRSDF